MREPAAAVTPSTPGYNIMPWDVKPNEPRCPPSKPFGVVKRDDDDLEGCHPSRAAANDQLAALHAAEGKGRGNAMTDQKDTPVTDAEIVNDDADKGLGAVPVLVADVPTTFSELQAIREAKEMSMALADLTADLQMLTRNIMASPEIEDKVGAVQALAAEFAALMEAPNELGDKATAEVTHTGVIAPGSVDMDTFADRVKQAVSRAIGSVFKAEKPTGNGGGIEFTEGDGVEPGSASVKKHRDGFMVYKDDDGVYRWCAVYSNKFRDRDRPPEILSEAAHREFAQAVKAGEYPYPELWLAHVRGTRCGEADYIAYDDSGFQVAVGHWDTGKEWVADILKDHDDLGVSHGMPVTEIRRDETDPTIITRYRTREISPLLLSTAANKLTGFNGVLLKESAGGETMPLQDEDRAKLSELIGEDGAERLEAENQTQADKAADEGLEFKEGASDTAAETEGPGEQGAAETLSAEAIAEAIAATVNPLIERQNETDKALAEIIEAVKGLHGVVEKMREPEDERIAEAASMTPAASLKALVQRSIIGAPEAKVDGRTRLAKDKPAETRPEGTITGIPLIDGIMQGVPWDQAFAAPLQQPPQQQ